MRPLLRADVYFVIEQPALMQSHPDMKVLSLLIFTALLAITGQSQAIYPPPPAPSTPLAPTSTNAANYVIQVQWKTANSGTNSLKLLTTEGLFSLDGMQTNRVKINNNEIPVTLRFSGMLTVMSPEKGRLNLFLGRNVPYVTGVNVGGGATSSTYQQMQVGLNSTYIVTFGKLLVVQSDDNEEVTVLVTRVED